jgi:DNA polymerase I
VAGLFDLDQLPRVRRPKHRRTYQVTNFTKPDEWIPFDDLPDLHGEVVLDFENLDPGLADGRGSSWVRSGEGHICGAGFGPLQHGDDFYVSIAHSDGNGCDQARFLGWLGDQARRADVTFIYANAPYDLGWLKREGIEPRNLPIDVQAQAALLDEFAYTYSLDTLGRKYLGEGKNEDAMKEACLRGGLIDPLSRMDLVPAWIAETYGLQDIHLTKGVYLHLRKQIEAEGLQSIHELERECALVAVDMKALGVPVDMDDVMKTRGGFALQRERAIDTVKDLTGINVEPTDFTSLIRALKVEQPGLVLPKTALGKESIRDEVLEALPESPVANAIRWMRRYDKAIGTFIDSYFLKNVWRGRIHADFNPLRYTDDRGSQGGTVSGRFSSNNPNMQNLPVRQPEIGIPLRACFRPEPGEDWAKLDYASQEPRLTIHYAALLELRGAQAMIDRFHRDPMTDLHLETALLMFGHTRETWGLLTAARRKELRARAKIINLAIAYGAGGGNIADQLGLPKIKKQFDKDGSTIKYWAAGPEAQKLLDAHAAGVPFLKDLQAIAKTRAEQKGYVRTILDRVLRFKQFGGRYARSHKALNSIIQGSAADQMKMALVLLRREKIPILLTVHDEADASVPREAPAYIARIKQIMEEAVPLLLPVVAEVKIKANWGLVSVDD